MGQEAPAATGARPDSIRSRPTKAPIIAIVLLLAIVSVPSDGAASEPACPGFPGDRAHPAYAGRPLVEALEALRACGLKLIFSSDLVRPDMVVEAEPSDGPPRQILDHLLASFGLEAREGPLGTVLVVGADGSEPRAIGGAGDARGAGAVRPISSSPGLREHVKVEPSSAAEPQRVTLLRHDDLARTPTIGDDACRAVAGLPGIASGDRSAQFSIRGGGSDEALIVLDGLGIDEPYHLKDFAAFSSIVDTEAIGRMDVLTGIFPVEYGDRAGGVIDLSTTDPAGGGHTTVGVSLVNASVLSEGRLGGREGSWLVSARTWRPDAVLDTITLGGEEIDPSYNDLLGKVQFQLPGGSLLSAHVLASRDDLQYRTDLGAGRVDADEEHSYAWITWKTPWTPRLYSQTLISRDRVERSRRGHTADTADALAQVRDTRSYASIALKQDWIFAAGERALLKWGVEGRRLEGEYDYVSHVDRLEPFAGGSSGGGTALTTGATSTGATAPSVIDRDVNLDPSGTELGGYLAGRFHLIAPLTLEAGVRRDRQTLARESETSPRVHLALALGERSVLRAGWGRFHQPEGINELQVEDGVVEFFPAQRVDQWEVNLDHLFARGVKLGLSAYVKDMSHLRPRYENLFDPFQLFPEAEPDRVRVAASRAVARGLEIELLVDRGGPLSWRASYARASAEERMEDAWVPRSRGQPVW